LSTDIAANISTELMHATHLSCHRQISVASCFQLI
jgi:hypothetical protein